MVGLFQEQPEPRVKVYHDVELMIGSGQRVSDYVYRVMTGKQPKDVSKDESVLLTYYKVTLVAVPRNDIFERVIKVVYSFGPEFPRREEVVTKEQARKDHNRFSYEVYTFKDFTVKCKIYYDGSDPDEEPINVKLPEV